jgi:hypothetical protein
MCSIQNVYAWGATLVLVRVSSPPTGILAQMQDSFVAFGCGTAATVLLMPFGEFAPWLKEMNITEREDRFYWHVHIFQDGGKFLLARRKGAERIDLTRFLLPAGEEAS